MARDLHADTKAAALAGHVRAVLLVYLATTPAVYLNNSAGDIDYDGETYLGTGEFGSITGVQESADLAAHTLTLQLSGIDPAKISLALGETYQNRKATIFNALLDDSHDVIGEPFVLAGGIMDNMAIEIGETASLAVNVTTPFARWEKPNQRRYTAADQGRFVPNDRGLEFVPQQVEKTIVWPAGTFFR